jgi:hypothetical protein
MKRTWNDLPMWGLAPGEGLTLVIIGLMVLGAIAIVIATLALG